MATMAVVYAQQKPALKPATPRSLALAGAHLSRTAGSMHESCLREKADRWVPAMESIAPIKSALQRDAAMQHLKYGGAEPSIASARFHVNLPKSPQNTKFSTRSFSPTSPMSPESVEEEDRLSPLASAHERRSEHFIMEQPDEEQPESTAQSSRRFNMRTLRGWFKDIDVKKSGSITQRELIISLRQHKGMQALFCSMQGLEYSEAGNNQSVEGAVQARREEVQRIKRILDEIDTDGSGTMEWNEFVEFFRRAGLLLEYQTRQSLNRCSDFLEPAEIAAIAAEQEREKQRATKVRAKTMVLQPNLQSLAHDIQKLAEDMG